MPELRVCVCTWNVATLDPPPKILEDMIWLHTAHAPDIYAFGLQEVSSKPHEYVQSAFIDDPWTEQIARVVCSRGYVQVSSIRLQGILLLLYARMLHLPFLRNIQTDFTRTGLGGAWGNKGGVSIRMDCYGRSLCIVNVHFAAHADQWEIRDKEYHTITATQEFPDCSTSRILDHDYVLWFGDMNYRFEDISREVIKFHSSPGKLNKLIEKDQLYLSMKMGKCFDGFTEEKIAFMPTYKYDLQTNTYDTSEKQRPPAWTDRTLWRVNTNRLGEPKDYYIKQIAYKAHNDVLWSDHKPVSAEFCIQVCMDDAEALVTFDPVETWRRGDDVSISYTVVGDTRTSTWDWIGLYKVGFQNAAKDAETYIWSVPQGETKGESGCKTKFTARYLPEDTCTKYVLCYYSKTMNCVLGISNVFRILPSQEEENDMKFRADQVENAMPVEASAATI
ncbi:phosphatidylinositol 4,5-bisphosphate 5-phosphatase A-like [Amphiura filiformis]|uniref:phosphatidylinositol 4,5-bisphosphate 5-phosphatase A-like n=1 Tax=Amphiura filiformis TaxID=82378 RepID=UPI003B2210BB